MAVLRILVLIFFLGVEYVFAGSTDRPKNIIILIGDGMGTNYVSAAVLQNHKNPFRNFTSIGLSITCSADKLITDSAAGATAISTGQRTKNHYVGVDSLGNPLINIFDEAERLGIATGLVVTCTVTHATPAAFVSHVISRKEETEIAKQYLEKDIDVVIGGGAKYFLIQDSLNYFQTGFDHLLNKGYQIFRNADELLNTKSPDKFFALIENEHLKKAEQRNYTLADLTLKALDVLSRNEGGFILMIEGSQIDWGGHDNNQSYLLSELNDFCGAISAALDFAEQDGNTLVLVTADHETGGMSINGGKPDGSDLELIFTSKGHSAEMVGVFAIGPGEELFRGVYDNYLVGRKLFHLINSEFEY
jgi:alkaline phosphatase